MRAQRQRRLQSAAPGCAVERGVSDRFEARAQPALEARLRPIEIGETGVHGLFDVPLDPAVVHEPVVQEQVVAQLGGGADLGLRRAGGRKALQARQEIAHVEVDGIRHAVSFH